jgi:hypothetical protein
LYFSSTSSEICPISGESADFVFVSGINWLNRPDKSSY